MRKLKLQMQISLDGFIAGPNGEMDWMTLPWTEDLNNYVEQLTASVDTILLGRKLAEGFIPHWANVASNPDNPEYATGKQYTDTHKVVFTKTLNQVEWINTELAKGDLEEEVNAIKQKEGQDIITYGGGTFVSALIKAGLIDQLHLFVNPTAIGTGMPIFNSIVSNQKYKLLKAEAFECGIVTLNYELAKD